MKLQERADFLLEKYNGTFTNKQAQSEGVASVVLSRMVRQEMIERVAPGIYNDPNYFEDEFLIAQARLNKGIYCRETTLYLYGMTDKTPNYLDMNFPVGYKSEHFNELRIKPSRQIDSLYSLGITRVQSPNGNFVKTYDVERTLCDIVRAPHIAEAEIIRDAFQAYIKMPEKNLNKLIYYAKKLKVENKIRTYMSVLL